MKICVECKLDDDKCSDIKEDFICGDNGECKEKEKKSEIKNKLNEGDEIDVNSGIMQFTHSII